MKKIKVAISQRIIPEYRLGVFTDLASRDNLDVTLYFGKGQKIGTAVNANKISGFKYKKLFTIVIPLFQKGTQSLRVWHPTLFFHLVRQRTDVILTEPISNIFNLFSIYFYCKLFKKNYAWWEPGGDKPENMRFSRKLINPLIRFFVKRASSFATYNSYSDFYLKEYYNVEEKKIFRAQNALDTDLIEQQVQYYQGILVQNPLFSLKTSHKLILFIGALDKRKRINNLITAVARLNNEYKIPAVCLIIGNGPDESWIKSRCSNEELSTTKFLGKIVEDAVSYILVSDLVVLPGQGGLSLNHALACGKPIIATIEGLVPYSTSVFDYIDHCKNGFVVKVNDIDDLAYHIKKTLTDKQLYDEMCKSAKHKSDEFTTKKMADGFEKAITFAYAHTAN